MGIYIPNMNIPKEEPDGTMSGTLLLIMSNGKAQIIRTKEIVDVIPVPDHGDLIDRDELFPIYADLLDGGDVKAVVPKCVIDTAPTIIPAEPLKEVHNCDT